METTSNTIKWIWFSLCAIPGSTYAGKLLRNFEGVDEIYQHSFNPDEINDLPENVINSLNDKNLSYASQIYEYCEEHDILIVPFYDDKYPSKLRAIQNPPALLYYKGTVPNFSESVLIASVGTRDCTEYGLRAAAEICDGLARSGILVVSGMAKGIDAASNTAALNANGFTIAVFGCGVDVIYPKENEPLYHQICRNGLAISEYPPLEPPARHRFPERNRIISGISDGVLVIEADLNSGALITADRALYQGRVLYAVPGNIDAKCSRGTNQLIQNGAKLVTEANDIIVEHQFAASKALNPVKKKDIYSKKQRKKKRETHTSKKVASILSDTEKLVYNALSTIPKSDDEIAAECGLEISKISAILMLLEIKKLIKELPGNQYIRTMKG